MFDYKKFMKFNNLLYSAQEIRKKTKPVVASLLKSPGTYFMVGNGLLCATTQPFLSAAYGIGLIAQCVAQHTSLGKNTNIGLIKFLGGSQGGLSVNAAITGVAGITMLRAGSTPLLGGALLAFGIANGAQAFIYGNNIKLQDHHKNFALAACEVGMGIGFALLGAQVNVPPTALAVLTVASLAMPVARARFGDKMPADLVYADMIATAAATFMQAGRLDQWAIAASRISALLGISRLATLRAQNAGKKSYLDIFRLPELATHLKQKIVAPQAAP